jgi:hypothetical protein
MKNSKTKLISIILFVSLLLNSCHMLKSRCYDKSHYIYISNEEFRDSIINVIEKNDRESMTFDELKLQITGKINKDRFSSLAYLENTTKRSKFVCVWCNIYSVLVITNYLVYHVFFENDFFVYDNHNSPMNIFYLLPNKPKRVGGAGIHFQGLVGLNDTIETRYRNDYINTNYGTYKVIATYITPNGNILYSNIIEVEYDSDGLRIINSPEDLE